jgi:predicted PurR-regulated permease PerM
MPHTREESGVPESAARREGRPLNVALTDDGLLRAVLAFALALFGLFLIWRFLAGIATAILVLLVGILLAVALSGPVEWLHQRQKVPRLVASILIMGTILGLVGLSGYLFLPTLADQFAQFFSTLPSSFSRLAEWLGRAANRAGLPVANIGNGPSLSTLISWGGELVGGAIGLFSSLASMLFGLVIVIFIPLYLAASPESAVDWTVRLFPTALRPRARRVLSEVRSNLLNWLKGRLISMAIVGVLSTTALYLIGIPGALFLGIFTGLIEFIPYFGPVIAAIPPILLALAGEPVDALWVILAYFVIQQLEGYLITPLIMSETTSLHPAIVIGIVTVLSAGFGLLGALVAVSVAMVFKTLVEALWFQRVEEESRAEP